MKWTNLSVVTILSLLCTIAHAQQAEVLPGKAPSAHFNVAIRIDLEVITQQKVSAAIKAVETAFGRDNKQLADVIDKVKLNLVPAMQLRNGLYKAGVRQVVILAESASLSEQSDQAAAAQGKAKPEPDLVLLVRVAEGTDPAAVDKAFDRFADNLIELVAELAGTDTTKLDKEELADVQSELKKAKFTPHQPGWLVYKRPKVAQAEKAVGNRAAQFALMRKALAANADAPVATVFSPTDQERKEMAKGGAQNPMFGGLAQMMANAQSMLVRMDLETKPGLRLDIQMPDTNQARQLQQAITQMMGMMSMMLQSGQQEDPKAKATGELLQELLPVLQGQQVRFNLKLETIAKMAKLAENQAPAQNP